MEFIRKMNEQFGPPTEALKSLRELLNGESGRRLEMVLTRVENLSKDTESLGKAIQLLNLLRELDKSGGLARLDSIMTNVPKGAEGKALITELNKLVGVYGPKIDRLIGLAESILGSDK